MDNKEYNGRVLCSSKITAEKEGKKFISCHDLSTLLGD